MHTSDNGRAFILAHEGNPLTVYLDPVGIPTVGTGLAAHNPVVKRMLGKLKPGTKYPASQLDRVFAAVLLEYVEPSVSKGMPGAKQHEFDAGSSVCYNLGTGAMDWQWADLWRFGMKADAAQYLGSHHNTAKGKKLPGLVRRRKEEALLLEKGIYTGIDSAEGIQRTASTEPTAPDPVVKEAQQLLTARGFNPGAIDGWMGEKTKAALIKYQEAHPHLVNDGIIGPATLSQLRRDAAAVKDIAVETVTKGGSGSIAAGALAFLNGMPWHWIGLAIVAGVLVWAAWRYRDVIARRWNTFTGKKVVL